MESKELITPRKNIGIGGGTDYQRFGGMMPLFLFILILYSTYIHSITFIQYIRPSSFAVVPLHLLIAGQLGWKNLPGVPSRETNSGLPYALPTEQRRTLRLTITHCLRILFSWNCLGRVDFWIAFYCRICWSLSPAVKSSSFMVEKWQNSVYRPSRI